MCDFFFFFFKEIQGYRGRGEDRGGERGGAGEKVRRGDGGDAREEDEVREGGSFVLPKAKLDTFPCIFY